MTDIDTDVRARALRDAYDAQLRARPPSGDPAAIVETVGPVRRRTPATGRGCIVYTDLDGMHGDALDAFIAEQRDHFAARGQTVEWRYHGYDLPADLPDRLRAAGFTAEEPGTIVIGEAIDQAIASRLPAGVELVELSATFDLDRVRVLLESVWDRQFDWLPGELETAVSNPDDPVVVLGAEAGGELVGTAWVRFHNGTDFASLWGGSTLPARRGRGIYRALVARRAQLALARGFTYLQVDCSPDSRNILRRLGMSRVATTVPFVWHPESGTQRLVRGGDMVHRHPTLERLDVLIGHWSVRVDVEGLGEAWTEFTWQNDGFLLKYSDMDAVPETAPQLWRDNVPFPTTELIGLDDAADEFTVLYADGRGVHRVYRMSVVGRKWRMWRYAPGFNQRFIADIDSDRIDGRWERSADGESWDLDFELAYRRR